MSSKFQRIASSASSQIISSLSSLLLSVIAARGLSLHDFGIFSIGFAIVNLLIGTVRGLGAETYLYNMNEARKNPSGPLSFCIFAGLSAALAIGMLLTVVTSYLGYTRVNIPVIALFLLVSFFSIVQDHSRFLLIALGKGNHAFILELSAFVALPVGTAIFTYYFSSTLVTICAVWAAATFVATVFGLTVLRSRVSFQDGMKWIKSTWKFGLTYTSDFLLTNGVSNGAVLLVGALGGPAASGALRGAQVLLAPALLITRGLSVSLAPEFRRLAVSKQVHKLLRAGVIFSGLSIIGGIVTVLIALLLPDSILDWALGSATQTSIETLPAAALAVAAMGVAMGAGMILRVQDRVSVAFRVKLLCAPVSLLGTAAGAIWLGAPGSQLGIALSETLRSALTWSKIVRATR